MASIATDLRPRQNKRGALHLYRYRKDRAGPSRATTATTTQQPRTAQQYQRYTPGGEITGVLWLTWYSGLRVSGRRRRASNPLGKCVQQHTTTVSILVGDQVSVRLHQQVSSYREHQGFVAYLIPRIVVVLRCLSATTMTISQAVRRNH